LKYQAKYIPNIQLTSARHEQPSQNTGLTNVTEKERLPGAPLQGRMIRTSSTS